MPDYTSNFAALLTGHLALPNEVEKPTPTGRKRGKSDDLFDARDIVASFVGKGYKDLSNDQAKEDYKYLHNTLGAEAATKLMNQVFIFNNRTDLGGKSWQDRVNTFYTIGSNDKSTSQLIQQLSSLDRGPIAGLTEAGNLTNKQLTGRSDLDNKIANTSNLDKVTIPKL